IKKIITILLACFLFFFTERLCHYATDGFAVVNISAPIVDAEPWFTPFTHEDKETLDKILCQKFTYLDSGAQCYVFLSEDKQTVVKFFKFQHMRIPPWIQYLPLPKKWDAHRHAKHQKKQTILKRTFESCHIAYHHLKEETGLLYIHLTKTPQIHKKLHIIDKIGRFHLIDLNSTEFIIQKRASGVFDSINKWMQNDQIEKAVNGITSLFELSIKRCKQGIFDKDPDFKTNFGFLEKSAIQIDIGRFSFDETRKRPAIYRPEILRITREFQKWIADNHPSLLEPFNLRLENILEQDS
ncbi:MAG: hypothetical protein KAR79_05755, partial [Simkaniaceae bacterium]|nr:hypothetical protein [Simkaniaceae bacterium]